MKYYCKGCESIIKLGPLCGEPILEDSRCNICKRVNTIIEIPNYETPEQYEKRTGESFPDTGLVWVFTGYYGDIYKRKWQSFSFQEAKLHSMHGCAIVIADPPVPPPEGWRPEEIQDDRV